MRTEQPTKCFTTSGTDGEVGAVKHVFAPKLLINNWPFQSGSCLFLVSEFRCQFTLCVLILF